MPAPTRYPLEYDDFCASAANIDCNSEQPCPGDEVSFSANRRVYCQDVTILDQLTALGVTIEEPFLKLFSQIKFVPGFIGGTIALVVDPNDPVSMAIARQIALPSTLQLGGVGGGLGGINPPTP